jgi:hypothetical protein
MLCEPEKWSDTNYGGYLLNKYTQTDIITGSNSHNHKTLNKDNLYKAVNYMSSVKFTYNQDLLNYLNNVGRFLLEENIKLTDSELYQRYIQLNVAKAYGETPFYIPLQADWIGLER